ncbi:MAG: hypothetical protein ACR2RE_31705 [Geminicoccaceae bacterium]
MSEGTCRHFNSCIINDVCEAGVRYRDVTPRPDDPGSAIRAPCRAYGAGDKHALKVLAEYGPPGTCDKFETYTERELAEHEAEAEAAKERMMKVLPLCERIKREHKGESWKGVEECPVCDGRLHLSHAAVNGHVWGKCETENCVAWME